MTGPTGVIALGAPRSLSLAPQLCRPASHPDSGHAVQPKASCSPPTHFLSLSSMLKIYPDTTHRTKPTLAFTWVTAAASQQFLLNSAACLNTTQSDHIHLLCQTLPWHPSHRQHELEFLNGRA